MAERLFRRFGHHYILVMMLATRLSGSVGGLLVVYYVDLILSMPDRIRHDFHVLALLVVPLALVLTTACGMLETRRLRRVLRELENGEPTRPDEAARAGCEAVLFPFRHHSHEAWIVPSSTLLPVLVFLKFVDHAAWPILINITIAVFMGIAMALMCTFFVIERTMLPVIRYLLEQGVKIDYDSLPVNRLHSRMIVCFSLIILITASMIGTLAGQRVSDIQAAVDEAGQQEAVRSLRLHAMYITAAAVVLGFGFSTVLSQSVASRAGKLVEAMKRVGQGDLSHRMLPTGNDEIDILARQFNSMVEKLDQNDKLIRDLNINLERKVRRRTRQLSKSKRQLQHSLEKLQQYDQLKTDVFSNVSHELRTPLTMILSPVERILEKHGRTLPADARTMLEAVCANGRRLLELINRLLEFSKIESGHAQLQLGSVDLNHLVSQLTLAASPLASQRGVELRVSCDSSVPILAADGEKLDTILSNLISNAIKFTPSGGAVDVETSLRGDEAVVSVRDTGIGISKDDQKRVFERFVQADGSSSRAFAGSGLGLALAKELVELHGGQIHLESEPGRGSRFWFHLPLIEIPADSAARGQTTAAPNTSRFTELLKFETEQAPRNHPLAADAAKILVVDDGPEIRALMADILGEQYHVLLAADGAQGIELAQRDVPDLIISDVMMPRVDGYAFCQRVKQDPATAQIPFVMLTAMADQSMKIEGLDCGADEYLTKPFNAEELRARVRSLLKMCRLHKEIDQRNAELEQTLKELRETQSQLIHSGKMSSLGQLVAGLAHEINNSINAVYNGIIPLSTKTQQLENKVQAALLAANDHCPPGSSDEIRATFNRISSLAEVIESGASRAARIVSDLKTFSHPGSETPENFDLHESLDMCINLLSNSMKDRITVHKDYGDFGPAFGPRSQLNQVFMNILNNAQQAMPKNGEIHITTRREHDSVSVSIRDQGQGIPEEVRGQIFDPFFTTKSPGVGTGLGLSISYSIVKNIGGTIECHSTVGRGTEFVLRWPDAPDRKPPEQPDLSPIAERTIS